MFEITKLKPSSAYSSFGYQVLRVPGELNTKFILLSLAVEFELCLPASTLPPPQFKRL